MIASKLYQWYHFSDEVLTKAIIGIRKHIVTEHSPPIIDKTDSMLGNTIATTHDAVMKIEVIRRFSIVVKSILPQQQERKTCFLKGK